MEEVDKIIIQSLISIGCDIAQDVTSIAQFDQDLLIESVAKLLNHLNASNNSSETLPTKLPPNTAVKFRICTKFATVCQTLGYKNEIGYQTFLYSNELEVRRLLMFLVEKLSKESSSSGQDDQSEINSKKNKNINHLISQKTKHLLEQFWLPPYLKLNGLRRDENDILINEGCKFQANFNTVQLEIPSNLANSKSKYQKNVQEYFNTHLKYVSDQSSNKANLLSSLIQMNTIERLKEYSIFQKSDLNSLNKNRKQIKEDSLNELKLVIKNSVNKSSDISKTNQTVITETDIDEIEALTSQGQNLKNLFAKGSRFQHSEKLQFTSEENNKNVSIISNAPEEKKEEEINNLKERLENLNKSFESLELEIEKLKNETILNLETSLKDQEILNKTLEDSIVLKKKTVNLINDAPMNILKLKEEINSHEKKMNNLKEQWNNHKAPLEEKRDSLRQEILNQKSLIQVKIEETKQIRSQINELNAELTAKESLISELSKEMEALNKSESSKNTNRQFYTKRILEICSNIDKQRKEIDKILIETKSIQKEINQLSGKLERIFNSTDELLFKDAKQNELNKKVYKLFVNINTEYEKLLDDLEHTSQLDRECRDVEDQVNLESQNKVADNMEKVMNDLKQIKQENENLVTKIKSK